MKEQLLLRKVCGKLKKRIVKKLQTNRKSREILSNKNESRDETSLFEQSRESR